MFTHSRHVPGVSFAGLIHPGLIGCLPDQKLLDTWNTREMAFIATDPNRVPPLAVPPFAPTAHAGRAKGDVKDKVAAEGARTVPPREHGGNCDIKDLSRGSKIYFPVYVKGAGLSMGDLHFSQGDGEITFCGAIEMAGWLHLKVDIIKGGVAKYGIKNPIFKPSPITPTYNDYLIFEGISVDEAGKQHYLDVHIAYRQACLNAIEYLTKFGYTARAGLFDPRHRAVPGPHLRRRRYPQRLRDAVAADRHLRFRRDAERGRADQAGEGRRPDADVAGQVIKPHVRERPMPVYDYLCAAAVRSPTFGRWRNAMRRACPACGRAAPRAFLTAPYFSACRRNAAWRTPPTSAARTRRRPWLRSKQSTAPAAPAAARSRGATASAARTAPRAFRQPALDDLALSLIVRALGNA